VIVTPKRRWYQFSLRTLLIAMVVASVGCGWVANYRYRMARAADHKEEARWCLISSHYAMRGFVDGEIGASMDRHTAEMRRQAGEHKRLAEAYQKAAWQPWVIIHDVPTP
jgi:hypothetical protein